jgi:hypothetical protein
LAISSRQNLFANEEKPNQCGKILRTKVNSNRVLHHGPKILPVVTLSVNPVTERGSFVPAIGRLHNLENNLGQVS